MILTNIVYLHISTHTHVYSLYVNSAIPEDRVSTA